METTIYDGRISRAIDQVKAIEVEWELRKYSDDPMSVQEWHKKVDAACEAENIDRGMVSEAYKALYGRYKP